MNKKLILFLVIIILVICTIGYFLKLPFQIARIYPNTNHNVSTTDLSIAKELFLKNKIELGTLAIVSVNKDKQGITHIGCKQFYNGLNIFNENITYHFDQSGKALNRSIIDGTNNIFISGERIDNLNISIEPSISMYTAIKKAHEKMRLNYFFTIELAISRSLLVWIVKPKGADTFPYAIIDANNGELIRYDDGIIIN